MITTSDGEKFYSAQRAGEHEDDLLFPTAWPVPATDAGDHADVEMDV